MSARDERSTTAYDCGNLSDGKVIKLERWWTWPGSNRRPLPCHGSALPAAPQAHFWGRNSLGFGISETIIKQPSSILAYRDTLVNAPCILNFFPQAFLP